MARFIGITAYKPKQRMVVIAVWAKMGHSGLIDTSVMTWDVIGVINAAYTEKGEHWVDSDVQVVHDGEVATMGEVRNSLPRHTCVEIVVCDWQKHQDQEQLTPTVEVLEAAARDLVATGTMRSESESGQPFSSN